MLLQNARSRAVMCIALQRINQGQEDKTSLLKISTKISKQKIRGPHRLGFKFQLMTTPKAKATNRRLVVTCYYGASPGAYPMNEQDSRGKKGGRSNTRQRISNRHRRGRSRRESTAKMVLPDSSIAAGHVITQCNTGRMPDGAAAAVKR